MQWRVHNDSRFFVCQCPIVNENLQVAVYQPLKLAIGYRPLKLAIGINILNIISLI